jgi:hypothetical protein
MTRGGQDPGRLCDCTLACLIRARDRRCSRDAPEDAISPQRLGALENSPVLLPAREAHADFAVLRGVEGER